MKIRKAVSTAVLAIFIISSVKGPAYAQISSSVLRLPAPGNMVELSSQLTPAYLLGVTLHPDNALQFDFLVRKGDVELEDAQKKEEYGKLVKYFLASLTIPDEDQWVNLSPYEKDRIIKDDFGKTEMGRDLLAEDYLLKQITSSLIYPESNLGKKFWDKVYTRAWNEYHTTQIPVNTFNKVWIVPDQAIVYESGSSAYILQSHLKVMLEEDYLSLEKHTAITSGPRPINDTHAIGSQVIKEIVLPELEKEVNTGTNFANLRQMFSGMILATWYKKALKESLLGMIYADKAKVAGVDQNPKNNELIYQRYLKAFKRGVFNYIKEDIDKYTNEEIPRKYFSGGFKNLSNAMIVTKDNLDILQRGGPVVAVLGPDTLPLVSQLLSSAMTADTSNTEVAKVFLSTPKVNSRKQQMPPNVKHVLMKPASLEEYRNALNEMGITPRQAGNEAMTTGKKAVAVTSFFGVAGLIGWLVHSGLSPILPGDEKTITDSSGPIMMEIKPGEIGMMASQAGRVKVILTNTNHVPDSIYWLKRKQATGSKVFVFYGAQGKPESLLNEIESSDPQLKEYVIPNKSPKKPIEVLIFNRDQNDVSIIFNGNEYVHTKGGDEFIKASPAMLTPDQLDAAIKKFKKSYSDEENRKQATEEFIKVLDNPALAGISTVNFARVIKTVLKNDPAPSVESLSLILNKLRKAFRQYEEALQKNKQFYDLPFLQVDRFYQWLKNRPRNVVISYAFVRKRLGLPWDFKTLSNVVAYYERQTDLHLTLRDESGKMIVTSKNFAQLAAKGGIDLNAANLNLFIKRDGRGVPLPMVQQDLARLSRVPGFIPQIIEIKPAVNVPIINELQQKLQSS